MNLCEQKNSSEKPCPSLVSAGAGNPKPEPRSRLVKPQTQDGQRFSVYALTENGKMRYIGLTSQSLARRLNQHFQDMNRPHRKEHKSNWLRACLRDWIPVTIKSLRSGISLDSAQRIEKQIIKRLRPQLVNVHEGGSSGYAGLSADAKLRHAKSAKDCFLADGRKAKAESALSAARAAKEIKRLASPPSEMDEELRWLHNHPRKTKPKVQQVLMRA